MRIGIEAQRIFRKKKHGMDMVILEAIRELQKLDTENEYYVFVAPGEDNCLNETANFKIISFSGSYPIWEQFKLPKIAKELDLDLLHCTSNTAPINLKTSLVLTLHDIIFLEKNIMFTKGFTQYQKFGNIYRKYFVPPVLKKAKKIITVSNFEKDRIGNKLGIDPSKLQAVYNGVGTHFKKITIESTLSEVRNRYNLPPNFLFFFGNTDPKKNTQNVLEAYILYCQQTTDSLKLVIGDYNKELVEEKLHQHNQPNLIKQFVFPGYIQNSDMPAILSLSTSLLYPSLRESFGIPILEGMACGTPVLTSNTSSMPEVSGGAALLIDPNSPQEIANGIEKLVTDDQLRNDLINKGLKRAADFSWKKTAEAYLKIYRDLLKK